MGLDVERALKEGYTQDEINLYLEANNQEPVKVGNNQEPVQLESVEQVNTPLGNEQPVTVGNEQAPVQLETVDQLQEPVTNEQAPTQLESTEQVQEPATDEVIEQPTDFSYVPETDKETFAREQRSQIEDLDDTVTKFNDLYMNRHSKQPTAGKSPLGISKSIIATVMGKEDSVQTRRDVDELNASITKKLVDEGIDAFMTPDSGEIMYRDEEGNEHEVNSSMLNTLWNSKAETIGAMSGAIAGGRAGLATTAGVPPTSLGGVALKVGATALGAGIGGFVGASSGRALDLLSNSLYLKEELEGSLVLKQAFDAGYYDTVTTVIGGSIIKTGAKAGGLLWKGIGKGYDMVATGNSKGALTYLMDTYNLSADAAKEITQKFISTLSEEPTLKPSFIGKVLGQKTRGFTDVEMTTLAITSTQEGAESLVAQTANLNMKVADSMFKTVDARAKDIHKLVNTHSDKNVGMRITEDLREYEKATKEAYKTVKAIGSELIDGKDYRFDSADTGLDIIMDALKDNNKNNPDYLNKFGRFMVDIDIRSADKSFNGLIDLRQSVNNFKYSNAVSKTNKVKGTKTEFEAINGVLNAIDTEIGKAVNSNMPKDVATAWKKEWVNAKASYAKMSKLKLNAVVKSLDNVNSTEKGIRTQLNKYGNDLDVDSIEFNKFIDVLKPATRVKVENAAILNLLDKYTIGGASHYQAVDYPSLYNEVKGLNLGTKESKHLVKNLRKLADLFKNDAQMAGVAGSVKLKGADSSGSMSTTLLGRLEVQANNKLYKALASYSPVRNLHGGDALINKLSVLMADPLKQKSVDDFIKLLPEENKEQAVGILKEIQINMAKALHKADAKRTPADRSFKKMYKQSSTGKFTKSDGALGKGVYLTDKIAKPNPNSKVISKEINLSKMVDIDKVSGILGRTLSLKEIRGSAVIRQELQDKGYVGLLKGNKAMLFDVE